MRLPAYALCFSLGLTAAAIASSCKTVENPNHCQNQDGDTFCAQRHPEGDLPFCTLGACDPSAPDGCVAIMPSTECYAPCGDEVPVDQCLTASTGTMSGTDSGPTGTGPTGTGPTTTDGSSGTTGPMGCMIDADCTDGARPFCIGEVCVPCDQTPEPNTACTDLDPNEPICDAGACTPCYFHAQCPASACNLAVGNCMPEAMVVTVDGDGGQDFMTIQLAVDSFAADAEAVIIINDASDYNQPVNIGQNKTLALIAADGQAPRWVQTGAMAGPTLTVDSTATVFLDELELTGNLDGAAPAVLVDGGDVWIDRSRVVANQGGGISVQSASGSLVLRNSFVGGEVNNVSAVSVTNGSAEITASTLLGLSVGGIATLLCNSATVTLRNSIVGTQVAPAGAEIMCPGLDITFSATDADMPMMELSTSLFTNIAAGDFHLAAMGQGTFAAVAQWQTGDQPTDIDDNARATVDGAMEHAGADLP